jgi:hypothetical protein
MNVTFKEEGLENFNDYLEIFKCVSQLRKNYLGFAPTVENLKVVWSELKNLKNTETISAFLADLEKAISTGVVDFSLSQEASYALGQPIILSWFQASYNPKLSLEMVIKQDIPVRKELTLGFPARAWMVRVLAATDGFAGINDLNLFPENFLSQKALRLDYPAFYFINRFKERFLAEGKPLMVKFLSGEIVDRVLGLSDSQIEKTFVYWLQLHEHFHRTGPLPLPQYLNVKSGRSSAAFEELRVDLNTIMALYELTIPSEVDTKLMSFFVFAERLLRYASIRHPQEDYDARSGQALVNYLASQNVIRMQNEKIEVKFDEVIESLRNLALKMQSTENSVVAEDAKRQKEVLSEFMIEVSGCNHQTKKFIRHPILEKTADYIVKEKGFINIDTFFSNR